MKPMLVRGRSQQGVEVALVRRLAKIGRSCLARIWPLVKVVRNARHLVPRNDPARSIKYAMTQIRVTLMKQRLKLKARSMSGRVDTQWK
jgi:hypothetical protein